MARRCVTESSSASYKPLECETLEKIVLCFDPEHGRCKLVSKKLYEDNIVSVVIQEMPSYLGPTF
jgi:hypothetical protein